MLAANSNFAERTLARSDVAYGLPRPDHAGRAAARAASISADSWILIAVVGIWMLSAFDLVMTTLAGRHGWADELNPLVAKIMTNAVSLAGFKLMLVVPATMALVLVRHKRAARWALAAGLGLLGIVTLRWIALFEILTFIDANCPPGYPISW